MDHTNDPDFAKDMIIQMKLLRSYLIQDLGIPTDPTTGKFTNHMDYTYLLAMQFNPTVYSGVFPYLCKIHASTIRYQLDKTLDDQSVSLSHSPSIVHSEESVTFISTKGGTTDNSTIHTRKQTPHRDNPPTTISVVTPTDRNPRDPIRDHITMPSFQPRSDTCPGYGPPALRNLRSADHPGDTHSRTSDTLSKKSRSRTPRQPHSTSSSVSHHRDLDDYGTHPDHRRYIPRNEIDHESFSDRTRILPRQAINIRATWNGDPLKWQQFKFHLEGWLYQAGLSYMLSPRFQQSYTKGGWPDARSYALPNICGKQFAHDQSVVYGALRTACRDCRPGARYFLEFCDPPDGLAVWLKFLGTFDHGDCLDTKIQVFQRQADTQWHASFPGGLEGFLEFIANAHAQMDRAEPPLSFAFQIYRLPTHQHR